MSRIVSFMDKCAKLIEIQYTKNTSVDTVSISDDTETDTTADSAKVSISATTKDIVDIESYAGLKNIDAMFVLDRTYEVTLDIDSLDQYEDYFDLDGKIIIKLPFSSVDASYTTTFEDGSTLKTAE